MIEKRCSKCGKFKALKEFYRDKDKKDGRRTICKHCEAEYVRNHLEQKRKSYRKYRETHREQTRESAKKHYYKIKKNSPEKFEEKKRKRRIQERSPHGRELRRIRQQKRRALKANTVVSVTSSEIQELLKNAGRKCPDCGRYFNEKERKKTIDHIRPLSKGGAHTLMNLRVICNICNIKKYNRDYTKFTNGQLLLFV